MIGRPRLFRGIGASPGVAIGRVFLLDRTRVHVPHYHLQTAADISAEEARLQAAIAKSIEQLQEIRVRLATTEEVHQDILEAHEMMLRDQLLCSETITYIRAEKINAEWAVSKLMGNFRRLFDHSLDIYMKERGGDIDFVGERILRNLLGLKVGIGEAAEFFTDTVIVAHDLSPADTALLSGQKIMAFVTEIGGRTSHTSIVARSLDVPAVVGVNGLIDTASFGDLIIVDGSDGSVILRPSKAQLERGRTRAAQYTLSNLELLEARSLPACTLDGQEVTIVGNIELPSEVAHVFDRGGTGIGLYRTEFMFLGREELPNEEDHLATYRQLLQQTAGKSVVIRTLDLGGDKLIGPTRSEAETNPALGLRAIRYCLQNRPIFMAQIAGLLRAAVAYPELKIMLPMISGLEELRLAKEIIHEVEMRLEREGKEYRADIPVGIMIEVPSAALMADRLAKEAAFFSIGTNDLLQYLLAIDRANERVAYLYRPLHLSVLRLLQTVVRAAQKAQIPATICGEIAGEGDYLPILLGLGFTSFSMNAGAIPKIKRLVRELHFSECQELAVAALEMEVIAEVEELVRSFLQAKVSEIARFGPRKF